MSDIVERLQSLADCDSRAGEPLGKCMREAAAALRMCQDYAHDLAVSLAAKHYPEVPQWEPLPDLLGLLTQIDNMTTGLERKRDETATSDEQAYDPKGYTGPLRRPVPGQASALSLPDGTAPNTEAGAVSAEAPANLTQLRRKE